MKINIIDTDIFLSVYQNNQKQSAYTRGGATRWCRVQKFECCTTGSRNQYIVIWWEWYYQIFSVLL